MQICIEDNRMYEKNREIVKHMWSVAEKMEDEAIDKDIKRKKAIICDTQIFR